MEMPSWLKPGAPVIWRAQVSVQRGAVVEVPAVVESITPKRVRIRYIARVSHEDRVVVRTVCAYVLTERHWTAPELDTV